MTIQDRGAEEEEGEKKKDKRRKKEDCGLDCGPGHLSRKKERKQESRKLVVEDFAKSRKRIYRGDRYGIYLLYYY